MVLGLCNSIEAIISEIVLCKTTLALPVRLRTEPIYAGPVTLYCLRGQAVRIKEIKQKGGYLSGCGVKRINTLSCSPSSEATPSIIVHAIG